MDHRRGFVLAGEAGALSTNELSPYVDFGGVTTAPAPFNLQDALVYAFFLEADADKLQAMCDKVFNTPSGGAALYHPLSHHVMLTFGTVKVTSTVPPWNNIGYVVELHAALWIMTVRVKKEGEFLVAQQIRLFIPAIFVDNPISLAGGREIHGFAKNWGWATLPDPSTLESFTLDAFGGNFGQNTSAGRTRLLALDRVDATAPLHLEPLRDIAHAARLVRDVVLPDRGSGIVLPGWNLIKSLIEEAWRPEMPQVFLRQFRSAENGLLASQQQIVEASIKMNQETLHLIDHRYAFTLQQIDSHPFGTELGIHDQEVPFGIRITGQLMQEDGVVVWQAGQ
jgi:hypothetical protein